MHKSSIYLTDDLKRGLADLSIRSGKSEAELIRTAIEHLVAVPVTSHRDKAAAASLSSPAFAGPAFPSPAVIGVGMGPGPAGLVTALARNTLLAAGRVVVVTTDQRSIGRAEMVVRSVAHSVRIIRVPFAIGADESGRRASLGEVADAALAGADGGELVAVALLGDPAQWTIFPELCGLLSSRRPGLHLEAIPGITTYQVIAGRTGSALGSSCGALIVVDNVNDLDTHLAGDSCVVLFKASTDATSVREVAARHGRAAIVGELTGLPGERTVALGQMIDGPMSYLATVVFPAPQHERTGAE